ncbi:hypothetical protein Syun_025819 [Stephania yunnanensis]|uniref:Uncharacterized protein n=1 Tax=Stephania yunnanensis TaxID=152371 RepID=A0AAP0HVM3_9MAGN
MKQKKSLTLSSLILSLQKKNAIERERRNAEKRRKERKEVEEKKDRKRERAQGTRGEGPRGAITGFGCVHRRDGRRIA